MAERLELHIELEQKMDAIYQDRIQRLETQNQSLQEKLVHRNETGETQQPEKAAEKLETELRVSQGKLEELSGELQSIRHHHRTLRDQHGKIKAERDALKKLNPMDLKKKLDTKKKELRDKTSSLQLMQRTLATRNAKVKTMEDTVLYLKRKLNSRQKTLEPAGENYMYTSVCGNFHVYPSSFQSEQRPFLEEDYNIGVIDARTGTCVVMSGDDGQTENECPFPEDVSEFISTWLEHRPEP